ncbi:monooxygenase family protein [Streptacidiphilus sp. MAP5-3]|uniref:monooxygenase family protein n=1 Tax=unclassified Streptacidiphilus TaxID=2643834 RepID=UPI003518FB23
MDGFNLVNGIRLLARSEWTRVGPRTPEQAREHRRGPLRGRYLAENDEPVAMMLIGLRVNRWFSVRHWVPVLMAMPRMLRELSADPEGGLLGYRLLLGPGPGQVMVIQYWRRAGDIRAFAHDPQRSHRPAETAFWKRYFAGRGAVGIWHEMLSVRAGGYQCLYGDMPPTGLGAIMGLQPAISREGGHGYDRGEDPVFTATTRAEADTAVEALISRRDAGSR